MADSYTPAEDRYTGVLGYRRCGRSGLDLPEISLGMWHNFGGQADHETARRLCTTAFDLGITHFDLANNYGPPPGAAEERTGRILRELPRHELVISTKAGYLMWPGPYGDGGSRKYLLASLDQSLQRLGLDHVDIFYHHRPDATTPLEETLGALDQAVRSGRARYAGISNYSGMETCDAVQTARQHGLAPLLIHQVRYNLLAREPESDLLGHTDRLGVGVICFCPLAKGLLTGRYLGADGQKVIPPDSRAAAGGAFLSAEQVTDEVIGKARRLNELARRRGQSLAQMALAWVLRDRWVSSALIGASRPEQIQENVAALQNAAFDDEELSAIDQIVSS